MYAVKKGDIVSRNSYKNDIFFYVDKIAVNEKNEKVAWLSGVNIRIIADSPLSDLKLVNKKEIQSFFDKMELKYNNEIKIEKRSNRNFGRILHLDGDKRYSEKTSSLYRSHNLNYVVKHIAEYRQPQMTIDLLNRYKPDIVIFTGHDAIIKKGKSYNDINNYRNSKYFVKAVKQARLWSPDLDKLAIFAGACQSYYEALISAGANFASSPARILIDFVDPLIIAETVTTTNKNRIVTMYDIEPKIRNGRLAISGIGAPGKSL